VGHKKGTAVPTAGKQMRCPYNCLHGQNAAASFLLLFGRCSLKLKGGGNYQGRFCLENSRFLEFGWWWGSFRLALPAQMGAS